MKLIGVVLVSCAFSQAVIAEDLFERCQQVVGTQDYQPLKQYLANQKEPANYCQRLNNFEFLYTTDENFYFCDFRANEKPCSENVTGNRYPSLELRSRFTGQNGKRFVLFENSYLHRGVLSSGYHVFFLTPKTENPHGYVLEEFKDAGEYNGLYSDEGKICSNLDQNETAIEPVNAKMPYSIRNEGTAELSLVFEQRLTACRTKRTALQSLEYSWSGNRFISATAAHNASPAESKNSEVVGPRIDPTLRSPNIHNFYPAGVNPSDIEGSVALKILVGVDGSATNVTIEQSSGSSILDQAAIKCAKSLRFVPGLQNGVPAPMWLKWTVNVKRGRSLDTETVTNSADIKPGTKIFAYLFAPERADALSKVGSEWDKRLGLQQDCTAPVRVKQIEIGVMSPITLTANQPNPTNGVWLARFQFERCNESKTYNAIFIAKSDSEPEVRAYFPGSTKASVKLVNDAMPQARVLALALAKAKGNSECKDLVVADMTILEEPHDVVEGDRKFSGVWSEKWTFIGCDGSSMDMLVRFTPDGKGGTDYVVRKL